MEQMKGCLVSINNFFSVDGAENKVINIPVNQRISVIPGDYIGW